MLLNLKSICAIFPAIWAVLSILLDTKSNDLQYVQCLQQPVNNYYDTHTQEATTQLEQQAFKILDIMYDSMTKHHFDRVLDAVDRVSDAVESDSDKVNTNNIKPTYDNNNNNNNNNNNLFSVKNMYKVRTYMMHCTWIIISYP